MCKGVPKFIKKYVNNQLTKNSNVEQQWSTIKHYTVY